MISIYPDKFQGDDCPEKTGTKRAKYFYMHGDLENKSGYDCFDVAENDEMKLGIHDAVVHWPDGTTDEAVLYIRMSRDPKGVMAGIAVKKGDSEARKWVDEWYLYPGKKAGNY